MYHDRETIAAVVIVTWISAMILLAMSLSSGCASLPHDTQPSPGANDTADTIWRTVRSTDWLASLFIVGFVCSLIAAGMGFGKLGLLSAFSCVAGLFLKAAFSQPWFYAVAGLLVLASTCLVIAGIAWKNKALREIVVGVQKVKQENGASAVVSSIMQDNQSKPTQALVQQIKGELKVKGEI